ncbi:Uncharacterised protein [Moraxella caprae]|uniref:Uncharacterized protein n=1 Tax=Moraxella caprae TaxID=90240 RepID=A0A378R5X1_9GAMM|nr:hypothetical protein [Moraxella caprae]STZ09300.1 Uncharacterised protein [Moraxella caprae]
MISQETLSVSQSIVVIDDTPLTQNETESYDNLSALEQLLIDDFRKLDKDDQKIAFGSVHSLVTSNWEWTQ